jgi:hypothetical protein
VTGSFTNSFISDHINDEKFAPTNEERDDILRWCAASLYVGGGDTVLGMIQLDGSVFLPSQTVSIMTTFFYLMACHPDIQQRARDEIDSVLGGEMAIHQHRSSLPYVNAMIKEIMRWGPVVPLGE